MKNAPASAALARLEQAALTNEEKDAVVDWATSYAPDGIAARLAWAADNGKALPLDASDLEEAYAFDMAAPTVRAFVNALACDAEAA